jgi:hypothetical protein
VPAGRSHAAPVALTIGSLLHKKGPPAMPRPLLKVAEVRHMQLEPVKPLARYTGLGFVDVEPGMTAADAVPAMRTALAAAVKKVLKSFGFLLSLWGTKRRPRCVRRG